MSENVQQNVYQVQRIGELENKLDKLDKTVTYGFEVVADTESKIAAYTDLQMVLVIVALVVAFAALVVAVFTFRAGGLA